MPLDRLWCGWSTFKRRMCISYCKQYAILDNRVTVLCVYCFGFGREHNPTCTNTQAHAHGLQCNSIRQMNRQTHLFNESARHNGPQSVSESKASNTCDLFKSTTKYIHQMSINWIPFQQWTLTAFKRATITKCDYKSIENVHTSKRTALTVDLTTIKWLQTINNNHQRYLKIEHGIH